MKITMRLHVDAASRSLCSASSSVLRWCGFCVKTGDASVARQIYIYTCTLHTNLGDGALRLRRE